MTTSLCLKMTGDDISPPSVFSPSHSIFEPSSRRTLSFLSLIRSLASSRHHTFFSPPRGFCLCLSPRCMTPSRLSHHPEVLKHAEGKCSYFQSLYFFLRALMKWRQHLPACVLVFMRLHWCTKKCMCVWHMCVCVSVCTSAGERACLCCINLVK